MKKWLLCLLVLSLMLCGSAWAEDVYTYLQTEDGCAVITGVQNPGDVLVLPETIDGLPVIGIAADALTDPAIQAVKIPQRVRDIAPGAIAAEAEIRGWNGSAALAYAKAYGHTGTNLSEWDFLEDVHDLTGAPYTVSGKKLLLEAPEAALLAKGDLVFVPEVIVGDVARTYRITALIKQGDVFAASLSPVEANESVHSMHFTFDNVPLTTGPVTAGKNVTITSINRKTGDDKLEVGFKYSLTDNLEMEVKLTYSSTASGSYTYDENVGTTQNMDVTETVKIEGSLKLKGTLAKLEAKDLDLLETLKPVEDVKDLLEIPVYMAGPASIKANFKLSLSATLAGNLNCTITRQYGMRAENGVVTEYERDPVVVAREFSLKGTMKVGMEASLSLNVVNMGPVISIKGEVGVELSSKAAIQYDQNVNCTEVKLELIGKLTFEARLGLKPEFPNLDVKGPTITFISYTRTLAESTKELYKAHLEVARSTEKAENLPSVKFLRTCSIAEEKRKTFHFYTGSTQVIPDVNTVIGQGFEAPQVDDVSANNAFQGWYTELEGGERYDFSAAPDKNTPRETTLYAHWSLPTYQLTLDYDWVGLNTEIRRVLAEDHIEEPMVPMRPEHRFLGFYAYSSSPEGPNGLKWDFKTMIMPPCDVTLKARWQYEEGYDPAQELIDSVTGDPNYDDVVNGMALDLKPSTGVQALLQANGISHPAVAVLNEFYYFTGVTVPTPVLAIPQTALGKPVVSVDGSKLSSETKAALQVLIIPNTVLHVTGFNDCPNLQSVIIEGGTYPFTGRNDYVCVFDGVNVIDSGCFANCPNLQFVQIGSEVRVIGSGAFSGTHLFETCLPYSVTSLGTGVFANCEYLAAAALPSHITTLPKETFYGCTNLQSIDLSQFSVIGDWALAETGLKTVTFSGLTAMGSYVVQECPNLKEIQFLNYKYSGTSYDIIDRSTFGTDMPALETLYMSSGNYTVDLTGWPTLKNVYIMGEIEKLTLSSMPALEHVSAGTLRRSLILKDLPSLKSMDCRDILGEVPKGDKSHLTLKNCPNLTSMVWYDTLPWHTVITIDNCGLSTVGLASLVQAPAEGDGAHVASVINMPAMTTLTLPAGTTIIGSDAFSNNDALKTVTLPDTVTTIGDLAFQGCDALTTVHIPEGVTSIGSYAFGDCPSLHALYVPDSVTSLNTSWLSGAHVRSLSLPETGSSVALNTSSTSGPLSNAAWVGRVILRSNVTTVKPLSYMPDVFVVVCSESSAARSVYTGNTYLYPPLFVTPEQADGRYFVRFVNEKGIVRSTNEYGTPHESTVYSGFREGDVITVPGLVELPEQDGNQVFAGWALDKNGTQLMPRGMRMPAYDLTLYAVWASASADLQTAPGKDGLIITGYTGNGTVLTIPGAIDNQPVIGIADGAFRNSVLTQINLPDTIVQLTPAAFSGAGKLAAVHINSDRYASENGVVYHLDDDGRMTELVFCPPAYAGELAIPDTVTAIGDAACARVAGLTDIVFPEGLRQIGSNAFRLCSALTDVTLPGALTALGDEAFAGCSALSRVTFRSNAVLGNAALPQNFSLRAYGPVDAANLADWFESAGLMYNHYRLTLQDGEFTASMEIQAGSSLSHLTMKDEAARVFIGWAEDGSDTLVTEMPAADVCLTARWKTVLVIEDDVLISVDALVGDTLHVPAGVKRIAKNAVAFKLAEAHIPATVTVIEQGAFAAVGCIIGDKGSAAQDYAASNGITFRQALYTLTFDAMGGSACAAITAAANEAITLPVPVRNQASFLGWYTDEACTRPFTGTVMPGQSMTLYAAWELNPGYSMDYVVAFTEDSAVIVAYTGSAEHLTIPEVINELPVTAIGDGAFNGNTTLRTVTVPASVKKVGAQAFANTAIASLTFLGEDVELGEYVFYRSRALSSLMLPAGLTALPPYMAGGCTSLLSVALPDTVASMGTGAFSGCTFLSELTLPLGLRSFDADMLSGTSLTALSVADGHSAFKADGSALYTVDGETLLYLCRRTEGAFTVPEGVKHIAPHALENAAITALTLPKTLATIGEQALSGLRISALALPVGLTTIGENALSPLPYVMELDLPDSLVVIGDNAFDPQSGVALYISGNDSPVANVVAGRWTLQVRAGGAVTGVTINPSELTLTVGQIATLTASTVPADADDQRFTWHTSDSSVVTVDDGVVTAVGAGTAQVQVISPAGFSAACFVTVNAPAAATHPFQPEISHSIGKMGNITYLWYDTDYSFYDPWYTVTVTASDPRLVVEETYNGFRLNASYYTEDNRYEMLEDGLEVTLLLAGTDYQGHIQYMQFPVRLFDNQGKHVAPPVRATLLTGDSMLLSSGYYNVALQEACNVWSSSNPAVATVDDNGLVTAHATGLTTIRHTYVGGSSVTLLRVDASSAKVTLTLPADVLCIGKSMTMSAQCSDKNATLVYGTDHPAIVSITGNTVQACASGTARLYVQAVKNGQVIAQASAFVRCLAPVTNVHLDWMTGYDPEAIQAEKGQLDLMRYVSSGDKESVTWHSSNPDVVTINKHGMATVHKHGQATVTATRLYDGGTESALVIASDWDADVQVWAPPESIAVGESVQLEARVYPDSNTLTMKWSLSYDDCATITEDGLLTGVRTGSVSVHLDVYNDAGYVIASAWADLDVVSGSAQPITGIKLPQSVTVAIDQNVQLITSDAVTPAGSPVNQRAFGSIVVAPAGLATLSYSYFDDYVSLCGVKEGTGKVIITLLDGTVYTLPITVTPPILSLAQDSASLAVGKTFQIPVTTSLSGAKITYTLSDNAAKCVTVSNTGLLTGKAAGSGIVHIKVQDAGGKTYSANFFVTVLEKLPASVSMPGTVISSAYSSVEIPVTLPSGWTGTKDLSNALIVSAVNDKGQSVYCYADYGTTSSGHTGNYIYVDCPYENAVVTVKASLGSVKATTTVYFNTSTADYAYLYDFLVVQGTTIPLPDLGYQPVSWTTSDPSVASVSGGSITGVSAGTATLTATLTRPDGSTRQLTCTVTVTNAPLTSLSFEQESITMVPDTMQSIRFSATPSDSRKMFCTSSDESVVLAGVSGNYVELEAISQGTATVTLSDGTGMQAVCTVTVVQGVTSIRLDSPATLDLALGDTYQIIATALPENANNRQLKYATYDNAVTVSETGLITAVKPGMATVYVTSIDGSCERQVYVYVNAPLTSLTLSHTSITLTEHEKVQLTALQNGEALSSSRVQWSSSNPAVAAVNANGLVSYVGAGNAVITARDRFGIAEATCQIICTGNSGGDSGQTPPVIGDSKLILPAMLTEIEEEAFIGGTWAQIWTSDKLRSIGPRAFADNPHLQLVVITSMTAEVDATAFEGCPDTLIIRCPEGSAAWQSAQRYGWQAEALR